MSSQYRSPLAPHTSHIFSLSNTHCCTWMNALRRWILSICLPDAFKFWRMRCRNLSTRSSCACLCFSACCELGRCACARQPAQTYAHTSRSAAANTHAADVVMRLVSLAVVRKRADRAESGPAAGKAPAAAKAPRRMRGPGRALSANVRASCGTPVLCSSVAIVFKPCRVPPRELV